MVIHTTLAVLVHGLRPLFLRGRWDIHCLASGFCAAAILLSEYFMITFRRGGLVFPREVWARALLPGFFAMLLAPVFFFGFNLIAGLIGYPVREVDDGRERRRRRGGVKAVTPLRAWRYATRFANACSGNTAIGTRTDLHL